MVTLINNDLANAMDRLERRILSLNYNGYFTNSLFSELKQALKLKVGFRVHPPLNNGPRSGKDIKFHFYGLTKKAADSLLKGYGSSREEERKSLFELYQKLQQQGDRTTNDSNLIYFSVSNDKDQKVKTRLDIPLWVKKCACGAPFFYNLGEAHCLKCKKNNFRFVLRGIIRLYSALEESEITERINTLGLLKSEGFGSAVCDLFARQEEPDCFQKPEKIVESIDDNFCSICNFNESCHIGFGDNAAIKDFLDPDEVIHQLQEKCRTIMGLDYQFPILLCDSSKMALRCDQTARILKYRAVDYVEIPEDFQTELSTTILSGIKKNDLIRVAQRYPFGDVSENVKSILLADNKKDFEKFAQCLLKAIVQLTDKGVTNHVWNTWEDRVYPDLKYEVKEDPENIIREFIEYPLFIRKGTGIIVTPLGYLGQKLGLMFTMVKNADEEKLQKDRTTFLRIAREFAPLLFHSLEYEMYNLTLKKLEKRSLEDVPNILLGILPKLLNIVAGAFWSRKQIENNKDGAIVPECLYAFKSNSIFLELQELNRKEAQKVWTDNFGNERYNEIKEIYPSWGKETLKPTVVGVGTRGEGSGIEYYGIKVHSRLLLPVPLGKTDAEALPEEVHGVFDLYFEQSEFVLHRHALDLTRELGFIFAQTANAAKQKQEVIQQGIKAAVAAIMSRNMSHNIGSHILARIKFEDILEKLPSSLSDNNKGAIVGLLFQEFHQYLQGKSDYLADISTEPYRSPVSAFLYRDVILPFTEEVLLLDYIARNEKLDYDKINIRFFFAESNEVSHEIKPDKYICPICKLSDGRNEAIPFHKVCAKCLSSKGKKIQNYSYTPESMRSSKHDVMVDLPGSVGRFAICNILEAIIRNATKHNVSKINDATKLDIRIKIEEDPEDTSLYLCTIWDNLSDSSVVDSMNTLIDETIVDHGTGILKQQNWGIAEMKICATLLQDKTFDEMERAPKQFLEACAVDGKFGYKFKILKARKVLLIGKSWDNLLTDDSGNKTDWKKLGCFHEETIEKALDTYRGYIPFGLIIFFVDKESGDLFKSIEKNLLYMGNRVLLLVDNNIAINLNDRLQKLCVQLKMKDICDKLKNKHKSLWSAILHYEWLKKKKANISGRDVYLYLGGDKKDELNSRWKKVTKNIKENFGEKIIVLNELKDDEWNNISLSDNAIVFDRHTTLFKENLLNKKSKAIGDNYGILFKGYYEPWDISSPLYLILLNPPKGKAAQLELFINLMEMASFKILVLDERVAEKAFEAVPIRGKSTIERFKRLAAMNIFISTHVHKDGEDIPIGKNVKDKAFCLNIENGKPSIKYKDNGREEDFSPTFAI